MSIQQQVIDALRAAAGLSAGWFEARSNLGGSFDLTNALGRQRLLAVGSPNHEPRVVSVLFGWAKPLGDLVGVRVRGFAAIGAGSARVDVEFDLCRGTMIRVPCNTLEIDAQLIAGDPVTVSAIIGRGHAGHFPPQLTITPDAALGLDGALAALASYTVNIPVPACAKFVQFHRYGVTMPACTVTCFISGAPAYATVVGAGTMCAEIPLLDGVDEVNVTCGAVPISVGRLIFGLVL